MQEWSSRQNHSQSDISASSIELDLLGSYFLLIIRLTIPFVQSMTDDAQTEGASYKEGPQA